MNLNIFFSVPLPLRTLFSLFATSFILLFPQTDNIEDPTEVNSFQLSGSSSNSNSCCRCCCCCHCGKPHWTLHVCGSSWVATVQVKRTNYLVSIEDSLHFFYYKVALHLLYCCFQFWLSGSFSFFHCCGCYFSMSHPFQSNPVVGFVCLRFVVVRLEAAAVGAAAEHLICNRHIPHLFCLRCSICLSVVCSAYLSVIMELIRLKNNII